MKKEAMKTIGIFIKILGLTCSIFTLGYIAWTNPEFIHWTDKVVILYFCIFIWLFGMKKAIERE